jgi:septum formation protein
MTAKAAGCAHSGRSGPPAEQALPQLILASTSRYRRELLARLGVDFATVAPGADETPRPGEDPEQLCLRLAEDKARSAGRSHPDALVIGSDQVALLDGRVLGKPGDHVAAATQLRSASGRAVVFLTALCVLNMRTQRAQKEVVSCRVLFRPLADGEIERYLRREQPYDCAGAIRSEGLGIALLEGMEGSDPTALVGLPLIRLAAMLRREGLGIP